MDPELRKLYSLTYGMGRYNPPKLSFKEEGNSATIIEVQHQLLRITYRITLEPMGKYGR